MSDDDDPPRSSTPKARSEMTELLLLLGVAVLVGAERLLRRGGVRARARPRGPRRAAARRGQARRRAGARSRSITSTSTCRPASSASRWPRSASASWVSPRSRACSRTLFGDVDLARPLARDLDHDRLPDHDGSSHHDRRAGAEDLRDRARGERRRCAWRGRSSCSGVSFSPLIWLLNTASNWMLRLVGVDPRAEFEEISSSEDLKLIIARSAHGGKLDPGEAGMLSGVFHLHEQQARQVMTPIPAVVTVDARRPPRRRCGARRLGPHAPGRDRGRQHRPHQGHRARELARAAG